MPSKAPHICNHPGCNKPTVKRYCEAHTKKDRREYDQQRGTSSQRGYDSRWQRFRELYINKHPLCIRCKEKGRYIPTELIHHKRPLNEGGDKYDDKNLEALCNDCHEKIHGADRWSGNEGGNYV